MRPWPAPHVYYLRQAVSSLNSGLIFTSLWTFYYDTLQLTLVQVSIIFIVITVVGTIMEVPTGVIADVYSRRLSVILGGIFIGLCYTSVGLFPFYTVMLIGAFLETVGDACISGALEAWITDEVGAEHVGTIFARSIQISTPMHWVGVLLSIGLAALFNYQVPILIGGVLWLLLTLVLLATMPETVHFSHTTTTNFSVRQNLSTARQTFLHGLHIIRQNTLVIHLIIIGFFTTALLDMFYRFSRLHFLESFVLPVITLPIVGTLKDNLWFGLFEMLQGIFALLGITFLRRATTLQHAKTFTTTLTIFSAFTFIGLLLFAKTSSLSIAVGGWLLVNVLSDLGRPIMATWLNQIIDAPSRATVLSINSQISMLGMLALSSGVSLIGDFYGVRPALYIATLFMFPIIVLYTFNWQQALNGKVNQ